MKNLTNIIYLFFSKYKSKKILSNINPNYYIESQAFMFHHYLATQTNYNWDIVFNVENDKAEDVEFGIKLANLNLHGFLDEKLNITPKGEEFLEDKLDEDLNFKKLIFDYFKKSENKHFLENTCLEEYATNPKELSIPISCHYCKVKTCLL